MQKHQAYQCLHYMGPRGEEREGGVKKAFDEILAENFPNLRMETDIMVQEVQRLPKQDIPYLKG